MGLFDTVRCDMPLPDGYDGDDGFQTKSLDCEMDTYRITAEGRLIREVWDSEPAYDMYFHGIINFYCFEGHDPKDWVWHEYNAKFTDGVCESITVAESERVLTTQ